MKTPTDQRSPVSSTVLVRHQHSTVMIKPSYLSTLLIFFFKTGKLPENCIWIRRLILQCQMFSIKLRIGLILLSKLPILISKEAILFRYVVCVFLIQCRVIFREVYVFLLEVCHNLFRNATPMPNDEGQRRPTPKDDR